MGLLRGVSPAIWQDRRRATLLSHSLAGLIGIVAGLAVLILADFSMTWLAAVCLVAVGVVVMLVIGQVRRALLALLAFAIPFHVGIHFFLYPVHHEGGPSAFTITPADTILLALLALWIGETALGRRGRIKLFPAISAPALLFIAVGAVSSLNAGDPLLSAFQIFEFAKGLVFVLFVANTVLDERDLKWALTGLMAATIFQSSLGIYQALTGNALGLEMLGETHSSVRQIVGGLLSIRPVGTFWHTNQLALFLGMVLPIMGALLMARVELRLRLGAALALSLGLVAVGFTLSRGCWIGLLFSFPLLLTFGLRRRILSVRRLLVGFTWLLLILLALNWMTNGALLLRLTADDSGSAASRIPLMRGALDIVRDYPIFGSGLNNYQDTIQVHDVSGEYTDSGYLLVVHNILLLVAAETGLLGLVAFVWLLSALAWRGFCFSFRAKGSPSLAATVVAGLVASGMHMFVQNMVAVGLAADTQMYVQFWFLAGLLLALTTWSDPGVTQVQQSAGA